MPISVTKCKLLLGEGTEEELFFTAFLDHLGIEDVQVQEYGGKSKLGEYLKAISSQSTFRPVVSLGVTQDVNARNPTAARDGVCSALQSSGLPTPEDGNRQGLQVKVFLLPDNRNSGMLEDLCLAAIRDHPEMSCIDDFFACVQKRAARRTNHMSKARIHAWLASLERPDLRLGVAAQKGEIPWDHSAFDALRMFLQAL